MNLKSEMKELLVFASIIILIIGIFSFVIFGIAGFRVFAGIIIISIPFYLILNNFELSESEKLIFSILLGLTIFPSLVYLFGLLISFRISMVLAFAIFIIIAIILRKYKKPEISC